MYCFGSDQHLVGREWELEVLEERYRSGRFEFLPVYGRYRMGKTALLRRFTQGKPSIYYTAVPGGEQTNLAIFSQCIRAYMAEDQAESRYPTFRKALEQVFALGETERLILVMEDFQHVERVSQGISSVLQLLIDRWEHNSKLFLILTGPPAHMLEHVLGYRAPLYGRRTGQIHLKPLRFQQVRACWKGYTPEEQVLLYGMLGGTPAYVCMVDPRCTVAENLMRLFLAPDAPLQTEPQDLLHMDLDDLAPFQPVLSAIAKGAESLPEIAAQAGLDAGETEDRLHTLIRLGHVRRDPPYEEVSIRHSRYGLPDPLFRFWYRFLLDRLPRLHSGRAEEVCTEILEGVDGYMGTVFREVCADYLWDLLLQQKCPISFHSLGRWWGMGPAVEDRTEIDLVGEEIDKTAALFAACRWTGEPVDRDVLKQLVRSSHKLPYRRRWYFLFSRMGYTDACREEADRRKDVTLVEMKDMF